MHHEFFLTAAFLIKTQLFADRHATRRCFGLLVSFVLTHALSPCLYLQGQAEGTTLSPVVPGIKVTFGFKQARLGARSHPALLPCLVLSPVRQALWDGDSSLAWETGDLFP